jgi:quercetin dioxygenase-like cupin family protein
LATLGPPIQSEHGRTVYLSGALPQIPTTTPAGARQSYGYTESLRLLELSPGSRGPQHYSLGIETVYVLDGAIGIISRDGSVRRVFAGEGAVVAPSEMTVLSNPGATAARALLYYVTPGSEPYQVDSGN